MVDDLTLDSSFLVDLERERARGEEGPAHALLDRHATTRLHVSAIVAGELACGSSLASLERWRRFLAPFRILEVDAETAAEYGAAFRYLAENDLLIGSNDLWIAATALRHDLPLATRNEREFRRVPGLRVIAYA